MLNFKVGQIITNGNYNYKVLNILEVTPENYPKCYAKGGRADLHVKRGKKEYCIGIYERDGLIIQGDPIRI